MLGFFITICIEGLEAKYNITLDRNWKILKNKKFLGSLPEQNIRTQSKPLIQDLSGWVWNIYVLLCISYICPHGKLSATVNLQRYQSELKEESTWVWAGTLFIELLLIELWWEIYRPFRGQLLHISENLHQYSVRN